LFYTASGIVTLCRWPSSTQVAPDGHLQSVTIPDAVWYNFTSWWWSQQCWKHV